MEEGVNVPVQSTRMRTALENWDGIHKLGTAASACLTVMSFVLHCCLTLAPCLALLSHSLSLSGTVVSLSLLVWHCCLTLSPCLALLSHSLFLSGTVVSGLPLTPSTHYMHTCTFPQGYTNSALCCCLNLLHCCIQLTACQSCKLLCLSLPLANPLPSLAIL